MKMKALKLDKNLNVVPEIDEKEDLSKRYSTAQIEENDMVQEKSILKRIDRVSVEISKANSSLLTLSADSCRSYFSHIYSNSWTR